MKKQTGVDKKLWDSIGNSFYSVFFAVLWSAVMIWEHGINNWNFSKRSNSFMIILTIISLFAYFILDWIDANKAARIDPIIKTIDIFLWLFSTVWISSVIVQLIRSFNSTSLKSFTIPLVLLWIYNILTSVFRDGRLGIKLKNESWAKERNMYDGVKTYEQLKRIFTVIYIMLLFPFSLLFYINGKGTSGDKMDGFMSFVYSNEFYIILFLILILVGMSMALKLKRTVLILNPLAKYYKDEGAYSESKDVLETESKTQEKN